MHDGGSRFDVVYVREEPSQEDYRMMISVTLSDTFTLKYVEAKVAHECSLCGFEANLYESSAEYECPFCKGIMCRTAQNVTWYRDSSSSDAKLQEGYYA